MPGAFKFLGPSKESIAQIPIQKPTWGLEAKEVVDNAQKIKATWLGHACFLVELPSTVAGVRGARILFDPVFSDRCSPSQWVGPKRFTRKSPRFGVLFLSLTCVCSPAVRARRRPRNRRDRDFP